MRRFLYISPFFPPMTRVGALRPLKFARHLPSFGWAPVVVCEPADPRESEPRLAAAVPDSTIVFSTYSRPRSPGPGPGPGSPAPTRASSPKSTDLREPQPLAAAEPSLLPWRAEDLNPLGAHAFGMPHALRAARAALAAAPGCEAIMVNADPYAALLVGARLARETGLPLIQDLRDPWSCCELRRHLRPRPMRALVDRLERRAVEAAAAVILNTQTARDDYRRHYADLPADRFHAIRNHADAELLAAHTPAHAGAGDPSPEPSFDRFTILFLGNFRRFVEGEAVIDALARVRAAGIGADLLQIVVTGAVPVELWNRAGELGVREMIRAYPFVPYLEIAEIMARADLLLSFSHPTAQRIPAKIYDYLISDRPLLVIADNPELRALVEEAGGGSVVGLADTDGIAAAILDAQRRGRGRRVTRAGLGIDSHAASQALAGILDQVTGAQPRARPVGERGAAW